LLARTGQFPPPADIGRADQIDKLAIDKLEIDKLAIDKLALRRW
jgi:hypothetical protein